MALSQSTRENKCMKLAELLRGMLGRASPPEGADPRSIVIMQRVWHRFSEEELRAAAERGWRKTFDGKEDPMFFVDADSAVMTVVKAGAHIIRVISLPSR